MGNVGFDFPGGRPAFGRLFGRMLEQAVPLMLNQSRFLRYYRYPHYHWATMIGKIIEDIASDGATIVDAPCGDGAISYWLIRSNIGEEYELVDISVRSVDIAKRMYTLDMVKDVRLSINCKNIFDIEPSSRDDIWLLINCLYLLPDIDRLLNQMRDRSRYVIGIFPYIDRKNYLCATHLYPGLNINEMSEYATIEFFRKHGYELEIKHDVTFVAFDCLTSRFHYLPSRLVQRTARILLNPLERFVPRRAGFYWIGVFGRTQSRYGMS
jgi:SAM-dependent methyltransferase